MEEIIRQIKAQQEINFINIYDQICAADLETVFDGENNSRYIFHNLHSIDRFFINPCDYVYEGEKLFGIPENLSIIDSEREGYVNDSSIIIERKKLLEYFEYVKSKINSYFDRLTAENLLQKPDGCEYTRLELILSQFRHQMWHAGLSSGITFASKHEWNQFTGLTALNKKLFPTKINEGRMSIYEIKENKKQFLSLLLLADEQEDMVDRYLECGRMFVLDDGGVKAECVVTDEGEGMLEIKNIATEPNFQGKGYAHALLEFVEEKFRDEFTTLQVGTGDSPLTIPFYEKCGFTRHHVIKDFFTKNYARPIIECGVQLVDMIVLRKKCAEKTEKLHVKK